MARLPLVADPEGLLLEEGVLAGVRERALISEFEEYRTSKQKRLKVFRFEAVRAGFKKAWQKKPEFGYRTIIKVAKKIPEKILQEDPRLLIVVRSGGNENRRKVIMAKIEGFRIKNYRVLKDVTLGKLWNMQQAQSLTPMTAVIGKNGVGKSSLFDAFGFLADCLKLGVEEACDARGRGGFDRIRSQGMNGPIEFQVYYKQDGNSRPITYELSIDTDRTARPYVKLERLRQRRKGQTHGWPFSFLMLNEGKGVVWKGDEQGSRLMKVRPVLIYSN